MRIAVMAAGAVGGYFGGRLAAAGHDVAFIARGAHRDAILRDGLKIESALGDLHLKDVNVTDDPTQIAPVDVVLFAVKLWDTETAGKQTLSAARPREPGDHAAKRRRQRRTPCADPRRRGHDCGHDLCGHDNRQAWRDPSHRYNRPNPLRPSG